MRVLLSILLIIVSLSIAAMPSGDYQKSCYSCMFTRFSLTCTCMTANHFPNLTTLTNASWCPYVRNDDGRLRCLPRGSYFETCRNCRLERHRLVCECQDIHEFWQRSELRFPFMCRQVKNENGQLTCIHRRHHHHHHNGYLPDGSYKKSCNQCFFNGSQLACYCKKRDGETNYSVLFYPGRCRDISNQDGHLTCSGI